MRVFLGFILAAGLISSASAAENGQIIISETPQHLVYVLAKSVPPDFLKALPQIDGGLCRSTQACTRVLFVDGAFYGAGDAYIADLIARSRHSGWKFTMPTPGKKQPPKSG